MDFDSFLASPRWDLLELIAREPLSPVELAEKMGTTVSYVSQQLKLLDAAGLLKKTKTGAAEKGKPRSLFSLSKEFGFLTLLSEGRAEKKRIPFTDHYRAVLNVWFWCDTSYHKPLLQLYFQLPSSSSELDGVFLEVSRNTPLLHVVGMSKQTFSSLQSFVKHLSPTPSLKLSTLEDLRSKDPTHLVTLVDNKLLSRELKGGHLTI